MWGLVRQTSRRSGTQASCKPKTSTRASCVCVCVCACVCVCVSMSPCASNLVYVLLVRQTSRRSGTRAGGDDMHPRAPEFFDGDVPRLAVVATQRIIQNITPRPNMHTHTHTSLLTCGPTSKCAEDHRIDDRQGECIASHIAHKAVVLFVQPHFCLNGMCHPLCSQFVIFC